ncbi:hypothetical protein [Psychrobacillus sp. FJAT-51614]
MAIVPRPPVTVSAICLSCAYKYLVSIADRRVAPVNLAGGFIC